MGAHQYFGNLNSRAQRKLSKLTRGQPQPVALDRIVELLTGRRAQQTRVVSGGFNPPRIVREPR